MFCPENVRSKPRGGVNNSHETSSIATIPNLCLAANLSASSSAVPDFRRFRKFAFKEKPSYFSQTLKCGTIYIHRPLAGSGCEAIHADVIFIPSYIIPSNPLYKYQLPWSSPQGFRTTRSPERCCSR